MKKLIAYMIFTITILPVSCYQPEHDATKTIRNDNAVQLTHSNNGESSQNPAFSPDGNYIVYSRFINGYNSSVSEIVKMKTDGSDEQIIVPANNSANVNVPFGCWVGDRICFASDRAGHADEIWTVNDDGTNLKQITTHDESTGIYYIEPVFNPQNNEQIVFEYVTGENDNTAIHQIAFLNVRNGKVTLLTDGIYDDRLPSWSNGGDKILLQRKQYGQEHGWKVYLAYIDTLTKSLSDIHTINNENIDQTDCSWFYDDNYILTSSYFDGSNIPNIFLLSVSDGTPIRITNTPTNEDGAPACSPDGQKIAFESHPREDEDYPSDIWIINR